MGDVQKVDRLSESTAVKSCMAYRFYDAYGFCGPVGSDCWLKTVKCQGVTVFCEKNGLFSWLFISFIGLFTLNTLDCFTGKHFLLQRQQETIDYL